MNSSRKMFKLVKVSLFMYQQTSTNMSRGLEFLVLILSLIVSNSWIGSNDQVVLSHFTPPFYHMLFLICLKVPLSFWQGYFIHIVLVQMFVHLSTQCRIGFVCNRSCFLWKKEHIHQECERQVRYMSDPKHCHTMIFKS